MWEADGEDKGMQSQYWLGLQGANLLNVYGGLRFEPALLSTYD